METRAYITTEDENLLRLTVREGCTLYSGGEPAEGQSWTFPLIDDGRDYVMGAQPDQPYLDADRVLAEHGWTREGPWAVGDAITGAYATITRACTGGAQAALEDAVRKAVPGDGADAMVNLIGLLVDEVRRDQAKRDADVMRKMAERSPDTRPPRGGTNGRQVYTSAAELLDPDGEGWGLNLPDHLKHVMQGTDPIKARYLREGA